jgi:RNA polymerase sigma-70 factor (sigma-E family)
MNRRTIAGGGLMEELTSGGAIAPVARSAAAKGETTPAEPLGRPSFDAFVLGRTDRLLRTAYLLTRDHALAEDLLQTALAKAWTAWRRVGDHPEAYVRKIMVNTYATWWRRRWTAERPTDSLPDVATVSETDRHDERHDLWTALGRLPRRQQAAVVLRYYEGLSEAETAAVLGCSVGTVKSQTSRALAKLRIDPALAGDHTRASTDAVTEGESR